MLANLLYPPLRTASVAHSIDQLSKSLTDLLSDMAATLEAATPGTDEAGDWRHRARRFEDSATQVGPVLLKLS